jgi:CRISPR type I-E-associated protein CasB/Cse2
VALLNARQEDVPAHLRHIVSLLASREVPIDWACLLCHLKAWNREDRDVQRAWSRSFWGRARGVKADDGQTKAVAGRNQPAEPVH